MKMNKWTLGLAAVGLVSLAPGLRAADQGPTPVNVQALTPTMISGYVDTSAVWNPGTGNANPAPYSFNAGKQDGFNINAVDVKIEHPVTEGQWAAGYALELTGGPDGFSALGQYGVLRQAYVDLRAPVGNGIDFKLGEWDSPIGYEVTDSYKNPNWTRSYGYSIEPTEHVGLLASYKFSDAVSLQAGVANNISSPLLHNLITSGAYNFNYRNYSGASGSAIESKKALVSLLSLTAPDSWGWLKGSALYAGLDYGPGVAVNLEGTHTVDKTHLYVGTTVTTPVTGLTVGAAWDSVNNSDLAGVGGTEGYASALAGYLSYKASDKLTLNTRFEYAHGSAFDAVFAENATYTAANGLPQEAKVLALTETVQYQLWDNVISRLEFRWDTSADGSPHFGGTVAGTPTKNNELTVAANIVYKF